MAEGFEGFTLFTMSWYRASLLREPSVFLLAEGLRKSRHARISDPSQRSIPAGANRKCSGLALIILCFVGFGSKHVLFPAIPTATFPHPFILWAERRSIQHTQTHGFGFWDSKDFLAGNLVCDSCPCATCWNSSVPLDPRRSVAMHQHFYDSIILWMKHHILAGVFIYVYCMNHA